MRRSRIIALVVTTTVLSTVTAPASAQSATAAEAHTVAENWISTIVHAKEHWGGSTNPQVTEVTELRRDERLLGYACRVEPEGFVVVSACKALAPVKAYSTISNIYPQLDGGLAGLITDHLERVANAAESLVGPLPEADLAQIDEILEVSYSGAWAALSRDSAEFCRTLAGGGGRANYQGGEVMLSSEWSQTPPYNEQCPEITCDGETRRGYAGCIAIAGAQVMRYWNWPLGYDWINMPDVLTLDSPQPEIDAVAQLVREIGIDVDMDYQCHGSEAYFADVPGPDLRDAFEEHYCYLVQADALDRNDYTADAWFDLLRVEFSANRPLPYSIPSHAIVADGWQIVSVREQEIKQYHMNWGHGLDFHDGHPKNYWYTLDAIHGSDPDEEEVFQSLRPCHAVSEFMYGQYNGPNWYYFDRDCTGDDATFGPDLTLQCLEGVSIVCNGSPGVRFEGAADHSTLLYVVSPQPGEATGIRVRGGAVKLQAGGGICLIPLQPPCYVRCASVGSLGALLTWEDSRGGQDAFDIERGEDETGPFDLVASVTGNSHYDTPLIPETWYYYRIRATRNDGVASAYSRVIEVRTLPW